MKPQLRRPVAEGVLIFILLLVGTNAFFVGLSFMFIPDGSSVGLTLAWLEGSPFDSYFWPGLLLLTFVGGIPLLAGVGLIFKPTWQWPQKFNVFRHQHWAPTFATYSGIIFCTWIVVQQLMTRYFVLQPVISGVGVVVIVLSLLPRVTARYTYKPPAP